MPITIGSNIASLKAQRSLSRSSDLLARTFERLSSGARINRASDDAAGLAIADSLKADARVASVAVRNANDGISSIAIADTALNEIGDVLIKLSELAEQLANGTYTNTQRAERADQFILLGSEIERIAVTTSFNGVKLLSGGGSIQLQVGFNSQSTAQITLTPVGGTLAALGLASQNSSVLSYSIHDGSVTGGQSAARNALDAIAGAIASLASLRGTLGATESRLQVALNNLAVARENYMAAESRIRDIDVATEAAELTRINILQQAGASVLAQANQQPQLALTLLQ